MMTSLLAGLDSVEDTHMVTDLPRREASTVTPFWA
jgi:hypothetical protein